MWYAVHGSVNVNCAIGPCVDDGILPEGVDVEALDDVDTLTASEPITSPDEIEWIIGGKGDE